MTKKTEAGAVARKLRDTIARLRPSAQPRRRDPVAFAAVLEILG